MHTAVIGHPIAHSRSPDIHKYWLKNYGLSGSYRAIDINPDEFERDIEILMKDDTFKGFNVTLPFKEWVIDYCDQLGDAAEKIGAVNTVVKTSDGRIIGQNTDAYGFWQNIVESKPDFSIENKTAIVLGAGGAARAVIYALKQHEAGTIRILNRTGEKADALAKEFGCESNDWDDRHDVIDGCALLVNTTSLGMKEKPELDINLSNLPQDALVNDIVYTPLMTGLLKDSQSQNNEIVTGVGMLLYQAQRSFEYWHNIRPDVDQGLKDSLVS